MTPDDTKQMEQEALAPVMHMQRMGLETLLFAWMAETGHGLNEVEIKTDTVMGANGKIFQTWLEPKVRI